MIEWLADRVLAAPFIFDFSQWLVGAQRGKAHFISKMVRPVPGERVLDVGCGVGACLREIPDGVDYVGIDVSERYIAAAQAEHGGRGTFICADVGTVDALSLGTFDRAFSHGVLHHMSSATVAQTLDLIRQVVRPGGVYVALEPCYVPGQSSIARFLISNDRGKYVYDQPGWERLLSGLGKVRSEIFDGLVRVPYTVIIITTTVDPAHRSLR
jgi:SAM-dependent methyltransferase